MTKYHFYFYFKCEKFNLQYPLKSQISPEQPLISNDTESNLNKISIHHHHILN